MENASRALMMAAGVLIGLMILSLAVYLITSFGAASAEAHKTNEQNRINEFNTQFTQYEGRQDITIHDIVTVVNLARSNNETYGLVGQTDSNYYIRVRAKVRLALYENMETISSEDLNEAVKYELQNFAEYEDSDKNKYTGLPLYNCSVTINPNTERVNFIEFTQVN